MKKTVSLMLLIATVTLILVACAGGNKKKDNNKDDNATDSAYTIDGFSIVRSEAASPDLIKLMSGFKKSINSMTGVDMSVHIDVDKSASDYELLVGNTDRPESAAALEELREKTDKKAFIIKVFDKKIVINGFSNDDLIVGVNHFINTVLSKAEIGKKTLPVSEGNTILKRTGDIVYKSKDLLTVIVAEENSDAYIPARPDINESCSYGKIIKLEYQSKEKNNGILLATKENGAYDSKADDLRYPILKSTDNGATWKEICRLDDYVNIGATPGYQPCLFELPEDIGKYKKGTVLFASCTRAPATTIAIQCSTSLGESWKGVCNVEEGGFYNNGSWSSEGVWEPVLKYEDGRLYCFYSDERDNGVGASHAGGHNQRLVYRYTTDLKTWSEKKEAVAIEEPNARPGMVALTKMGNGKWALAYEGCSMGYSTCAVHVKFADTLDSWDAADKGTLIKDGAGCTMGSSPAIAWTPDGGECGTLFVTASVSTDSLTRCNMFVSFDYGKTFTSFGNPINLKNSEYGGYSAGMYVDMSGILYYVNNPENPNAKIQEKLEFMRLKVY